MKDTGCVKENAIHARREAQKKDAWIKNVMRSMHYSKEEAEKQYKKIFEDKNGG